MTLDFLLIIVAHISLLITLSVIFPNINNSKNSHLKTYKRY